MPVAAGSSADEHAVFVFKRHGKPVDFRLDGVIVRLRYQLVHAPAEREQLLIRENIGQAFQRNLMANLLELRQRDVSDALGLIYHKLTKLFLSYLLEITTWKDM